jgi:hypothetical protein
MATVAALDKGMLVKEAGNLLDMGTMTGAAGDSPGVCSGVSPWWDRDSVPCWWHDGTVTPRCISGDAQGG